MKKILTGILILVTTIATAQKEFNTKGLRIEISKTGKITSFYGDREYLPANAESFLIRANIEGEDHTPASVTWKGNVATASFPDNVRVTIKGTEADKYLKFEVVKLDNEEAIDVLFWGPFATSISETIGEYVGVVRNEVYALGYQSLNSKTTGGKKLNQDGSDESRGTTASRENHGSNLQGYCINRAKPRIYNIWNNRIENAVTHTNPDGELKGSAIALFGTEVENVLNVIENIELNEGLPHVTINGEWVKRSREANKPYFITNFTEDNIEEVLEYCQKLGYNTLYHGHPFKNWGHFDLLEDQFPNGWDGMKSCVEKANALGIRIGVHVLTNFITTNDPYVTPVPSKGLMTFSETVLAESISADTKEIAIKDGKGYLKKNTCQAIRIGDEIIQFASATNEAPYILKNCKRGAYNTIAAEHKSGMKVARLADHGYKTLFPTFELQKEMISRLANFFNNTGVGQLDFDGHEGGWGTGEGEFGMDYFSNELISQVNHELRNGSSRSNHYYWHVNSYLNWGEPWYGGFTKSQGHYRYQNQALLKRNYTPNMLGWFLLNPTTTLQEFEYMLARSAGYDAGYALYSTVTNFKRNPEFDKITEAVRIWEEARLKEIFTEKQIRILQDVKRDFSLKKLNENTFELQHYKKEKFELLNEMLQPGQPNDVIVEFDSPTDQDLYFVMGAVGENGSINQISVIFNGYETLKLDINLESNWAITYRGGNEVLVYDDKGRFKDKIELDINELKLTAGDNNLRISAEFSDGADIKLEGYTRLKNKTEIIESE